MEKAKDVSQLTWGPLPDYYRQYLKSSYFEVVSSIYDTFTPYYRYYYRQKDIENFTNLVFKDIAQQLGIPFEELLPILQKENSEFFDFENRIFNKRNNYRIRNTDPLLDNLLALLKIPKIDNVQYLIEKFNELSQTERIEFLNAIDVIEIKFKKAPDM